MDTIVWHIALYLRTPGEELYNTWVVYIKQKNIEGGNRHNFAITFPSQSFQVHAAQHGARCLLHADWSSRYHWL